MAKKHNEPNLALQVILARTLVLIKYESHIR